MIDIGRKELYFIRRKDKKGISTPIDAVISTSPKEAIKKYLEKEKYFCDAIAASKMPTIAPKPYRKKKRALK